MLMILSPSKRQRFNATPESTPVFSSLATRPEWEDKAERLVTMLRAYAPHELASLLQVSDAQAVVQAGYFQSWRRQADYPEVQPAVMAFDGDAYRTLEAASLPEAAWQYLARHLRILSALYGILRPFDLIGPYRLDFGASALRPDGASLYDYWKKPVTESLNRALAASGSRVLVNLASAEFARLVDKERLNGQMITPVFQEMRQGKPRVLGLYAKQARGRMVRYAARHNLKQAEALMAFAEDGYRFEPACSGESVWVFRR